MIVSDGAALMLEDSKMAEVALTKDGHLLFGNIRSSDVPALQIEQMVTGFGIIVANGKPTVAPGGEIAQRTAIGVDAQGRLMIFQADGVEALDQGLTAFQLAQWMADMGAIYVLNLDGGGSAVSVLKGKVISVPTCHDVPYPRCERRITTITCIR